MRALREERRTITEKQPVSGGAAGPEMDTVQVTETDADAAGRTLGMQPAPHSGPTQAVPRRERSVVPATDADTVPLAQQPRRAGTVVDTGPHPSVDPSSTARVHHGANPNPDPNAAPHAGDDRRAAAACSALRADAPELLETLKRHGIAERLALLDDVSAGGRKVTTASAGGSALSQVMPGGVKDRVRVRFVLSTRLRAHASYRSVCSCSSASAVQHMQPDQASRVAL